MDGQPRDAPGELTRAITHVIYFHSFKKCSSDIFISFSLPYAKAVAQDYNLTLYSIDYI